MWIQFAFDANSIKPGTGRDSRGLTKTRETYSQAWPDYSRLRNSQETLEYCICTSATIVAEPIRLQSGYEECGDDVCGRNLAYLER